MIGQRDFEGLVQLSKTDLWVKEMLEKLEVYYILLEKPYYQKQKDDWVIWS